MTTPPSPQEEAPVPQERQPYYVNNGLALWWVSNHNETVIARTEQEARDLHEVSDTEPSGPVTWDGDVRDEDDGSIHRLSDLFMSITDCPENTFPCVLTSEG